MKFEALPHPGRLASLKLSITVNETLKRVFMRFAVLASGSRANCTYFESAGTRILIDCGLSGRQTEQRLLRLGISAESLDAILVTHEHRDHINGVSVLSRRHKLPVYTNTATSEFIPRVFGFEYFDTGSSFCVGSLEIAPFRIVHDALDPVGFTVKSEGLKFVQLTDLGRVTPLIRDAVQSCNAIVLESNYDTELLQICDYPWMLKQRISSTHGHLSNTEAADLLEQIEHDELFQIVLGHLSENSNTPELARATVSGRLSHFSSSLLLDLELFGVVAARLV